ncbi:MAG: hypothetical protein HY514_04590 [Candidatus Aenigmarchaeota archaeon]|nr:hypothetical protein [Candidatus Aenigmarchaeota archaeon]
MPKRKNPWIAAILNFILWGLGYLYNGKRLALGLLLLIGDMMQNIIWLFVGADLPLMLAAVISFVLISIGLAYDAFKEAKKMK